MSLTTVDFIDCVRQICPSYNKTKAMHIVNGMWFYYSEYHRFYHTLEHVEHGLNLLKEVKDLCDDYYLVLYSWWYHDIIYLPNTLNNELVSADKAVFDAFQLGVTDDDATLKIYNMVLATKHLNNKAVSHDDKIIHDLDLAILGSNDAEYHSYRAQIKDEYNMYRIDKYLKGRLMILNDFLKLKNIYYIEYFQNHFEEKARKNISGEIENIKRDLILYNN